MTKASEGPSQCDDNAILGFDRLATVGNQITSSQVMSGYYNSSDKSARGCFEPVSITLSTPEGGVPTNFVTFDIAEPVLCSPLVLSDESPFFANISTLSIQYNMSNLQDAFVNALQVAPLAGTVVSLGSQAFLEYEVISLDNRIVSIPRVYMTPYVLPQYFTKQANGTVATNGAPALINIVSDTLRLASMPEHITIYCVPSIANRASFPSQIADSFFAWGTIASQLGAGTGCLSIQLNNRQGLLQAASVKELYRITRRNGYQYSYQTWLKSGGPIILRPETDLGLSPENSDIFPMMTGSVLLQATCSFTTKNFTDATVQLAGVTNLTALRPELYVICHMKGVAEISADSMALNLGPLSAVEVNALLASAPAKGESIPSPVLDAFEPEGAGLFSGKKSLMGSVARGVSHGGMGGSVMSGAGLRRK
jgi:hypothetical protein